MKTFSTLLLLLVAAACVKSQSTQQEQRPSANDSIKKVVVTRDTLPMLQLVPKDWYVKAAVNDSDVADFSTKCVVFALYSDKELDKMEKESDNEDNWNSFYDDYSFYANEASQFLTEKAFTKMARIKKYIRFSFANGKKIIVEREKNAGVLFFFDPNREVTQCASTDFTKEKYKGF
ncbi:MAG: hypothetical protein Q8861_10530 [Bacteroidota bacterium]|nr:hypothetical protein [Bacteroidota bacterium]